MNHLMSPYTINRYNRFVAVHGGLLARPVNVVDLFKRRLFCI